MRRWHPTSSEDPSSRAGTIRSRASTATAAATRGPRTSARTWCRRVTAEFLAFSKERGNDLSTPQPALGFRGLEPGDRWCLCAERWQEALDAGVAPDVVLEATHIRALEWASLGDLRRHATS